MVQVSLLEGLNLLYQQKQKLIQHLPASFLSSHPVSMNPLETFSNDSEIKLPFYVEGTLISAGTYPDKYFGEVVITPEDLQRSMKAWEGINLYKSHKVYPAIQMGEQVSSDEVVGKIVKTNWKEKENAVGYIAIIVDKGTALRIAHRMMKYVSAGFSRNPVPMNNGTRYQLKDIEPREVSLVYDPRDPHASIAPMKV